MSKIVQLSSDDYESLMKEKKVWNLDVREKYEYAMGHIRGAHLVPSTRFEEEFEKLKIKKTDKIGVYCRSGSRSDFIAKKLVEMGHKNIYNLEMGILEWLEYGKKLVK